MIYLDASDNVVPVSYDEEGNRTDTGTTPCNLSWAHGNLWAMVRCANLTAFEAQALAVGLMVEDEEGNLTPAKGVTIAHLGPITEPGATEEDPPVAIDARHHANFWLSPELVERGLWKTWAKAWSQNGTPAVANKDEEAVSFQGIELVDPDTVGSPANVLL